MSLKKNVRITLFDKEGRMESERMVTQGPEFYSGAKEIAPGPFRIEFTFEDHADVGGAIAYLQQLVGLMPIREKGTPGYAKKDKPDNDAIFDNDKEKALSELIENASDQDDFIKKLRANEFVFVNSGLLKFIVPETYQIKKMHQDKYDWLIRRIKIAKDPKNDKYDTQVLIGLSMSHGRQDKIIVYLYGEFSNRYVIAVPEKRPLKLSKTNLLKFPAYMNEEERLKWGFEHRTLFNNPEKAPTKFYMRWVKDVVVGDELSIDWKTRNNETKN